jgi:hypothetical protein
MRLLRLFSTMVGTVRSPFWKRRPTVRVDHGYSLIMLYIICLLRALKQMDTNCKVHNIHGTVVPLGTTTSCTCSTCSTYQSQDSSSATKISD